MAMPPTLYEATLVGRLEVWNAYLAAGKGTPWLYPWDTLIAVYIFLGVIVRPYLGPKSGRISGYLALAAIVAHSTYIILYRRTLGLAGGYIIGLTCIWGTIMTVVLLLLHDPTKDFARLEIREAAAASAYVQGPEGVSYSVDSNKALAQSKQRTGKTSTQVFMPSESKQNRVSVPYRLIWQPFPTEPLHVIDWTCDLISQFRGLNWNIRIPTVTKIKTIPPPPHFQVSKAIETSMLANETMNPSNPTPAYFRQSIINTAWHYIAIDILKFVMITDPYLIGLHPLNYPSPWPFFHHQPFLTKLVRLVISLCGVIAALNLIFSLAPLCMYTIMSQIIPQRTLLKVTKAPLYDPRAYERTFGPLWPTISTNGLSGFWGKFWHQFFRLGLSEPSIPLVKALNLDPKSQLGRTIQLLIAFCLSGIIHACASYTTFSIVPSKPLDPWLFFMLQAVGVILQEASTQFLTKRLNLKFPATLRKSANVAFVAVWLWFTGPLLADDFARCGIWLFEPIPVSPLLGITGQGWWRWRGQFFAIWRGDSIFSSGLAIL